MARSQRRKDRQESRAASGRGRGRTRRERQRERSKRVAARQKAGGGGQVRDIAHMLTVSGPKTFLQGGGLKGVFMGSAPGAFESSDNAAAALDAPPVSGPEFWDRSAGIGREFDLAGLDALEQLAGAGAGGAGGAGGELEETGPGGVPMTYLVGGGIALLVLLVLVVAFFAMRKK